MKFEASNLPSLRPVSAHQFSAANSITLYFIDININMYFSVNIIFYKFDIELDDDGSLITRASQCTGIRVRQKENKNRS